MRTPIDSVGSRVSTADDLRAEPDVDPAQPEPRVQRLDEHRRPADVAAGAAGLRGTAPATTCQRPKVRPTSRSTAASAGACSGVVPRR